MTALLVVVVGALVRGRHRLFTTRQHLVLPGLAWKFWVSMLQRLASARGPRLYVCPLEAFMAVGVMRSCRPSLSAFTTDVKSWRLCPHERGGAKCLEHNFLFELACFLACAFAF